MAVTRRQRARSLSKDDSLKNVQTGDAELQEKTHTKKSVVESSTPASPSEPAGKETLAFNTATETRAMEHKDDSKSKLRREKRVKNLLLGDRQRKKKEKNELTKLIPGYTAPMQLNTSSLGKYRPSGGIQDLKRRAARTDASTKSFVVEATKQHTDAMQKDKNGLLPTSYAAAYSSFKKGTKRPPDETAGDGWFGMNPTPMTEQMKMDLMLIRNRNYLDPKKFYKSADKHHKIAQLGTVIEGTGEFFSSRLTKKQRRSNLTDEILADPSSSDWVKNKYKKMQKEKSHQHGQKRHKTKKARRFF